MIDTQNITQITEDVWTAMLGVEVKPNPPSTERAPGARVVSGCVQITGEWDGAVVIECSLALASRATALMFAMEEGEAQSAEVHDAVGELANMTGGNLKSMLGGDCALSLPAVTEGADQLVSIPGGEVVERVAFDCDGELLVVSAVERRKG